VLGLVVPDTVSYMSISIIKAAAITSPT